MPANRQQLTRYSVTSDEKGDPSREGMTDSRNSWYYGIGHAFDAVKEIDRKQEVGIKKGDIVFMYAGASASAILYKCKVTEIDIPYQYQHKGLTTTKLMCIRLVRKYKR